MYFADYFICTYALNRRRRIIMTNETFNAKMNELCYLKRFALKHGQALRKPDRVQKEISVTYMSAGDVAEIWMAYMLGLFSAIAEDGLRVFITTSLDREGVDFCLKRFKSQSYIQMKFCKHNDKIYSDDIKVVELGAAKGFSGRNELPSMNGNEALYNLLFESGLYDEDEIYLIFESRRWFETVCKDVWKLIR